MSGQGPDRFRADGPDTREATQAPPPIYELSVQASRELDRRAVEEYEIPSIVLMENAAIGVHRHAMRLLHDAPHTGVLVCCGPGNNGGDGFALARHLHNNLIPLRVVHTQDPDEYSGDAEINLTVLEHMGVELVDARSLLETQPDASLHLVVDALFGTGLTREIDGIEGELIEWINKTRQQRNTLTLAVDVPSGLDAQEGVPLGERVIRADCTVTFAGPKPGMSNVEALDYLGEVHTEPIGVPIELLRELGTPIEPKHRD